MRAPPLMTIVALSVACGGGLFDEPVPTDLAVREGMCHCDLPDDRPVDFYTRGGIDRFVMLRFEADPAEVPAFLASAGLPELKPDPSAFFNGATEAAGWWVKEPSPGSRGARMSTDAWTAKVRVDPGPGERVTIFLWGNER
ncbi:MAG: hypothetical protein AAFV53_24725 [Myxococcota bacterium]